MYFKLQRTLIGLAIMAVVSACGMGNNPVVDTTQPVEGADIPTEMTQSVPMQPSIDPNWTMQEEAGVWPDYIPSDIPEFEGRIRNVMVAPESHIRIFYEGITKDQVDRYLRLLEQKGFQLEYQVYIQEGFPDNSEERLKEGDYDAVDITKGNYHMNLGYGEGNIAYDIYTSGFAEMISTPAGLDLLVDLETLVPKPERCMIEKITSDGSGGYQITCRPSDENVGSDYLQVLQAAGFLPKPSSPIVSVNGVYGKDDLEIMVEQHSTALVLITVRRIDLSNTSWPVELNDIVPQPNNCAISNVLKLEGINYVISCQGEGNQVVDDYVDLLKAEGFIETNRMTMPSGELVSVSFEGNSLKVKLLISQQEPLGNLGISISEMP